jgi:acetyl esterase
MKNYKFDQELQPYVAYLPSVIDFSSITKIKEFRSTLANSRPELTKVNLVEIQDFCIPSSDGGAIIPARSYRPRSHINQTLPAIYEIHGGGFILGDLEMQDQWCIDMCLKICAVVISVDYRLAPENPFPAAPNDCYQGFNWVFENAKELGINSQRIAISGQSAGACLAAVTTIRARDEDGPKACFQLLEIPVTDNRLSTTSMLEFSDTPMWNKPNAIWGWRHFLGSDYLELPPRYAVPAKEKNLSGLPNTYISVMEFDPLRDEGIEFALRLMQAGVSVELHSYPGTFHGSTLISNAGVTKRNMAEIVEVLKNKLHN